MSNLIRQKIVSAINSLGVTKDPKALTFMIFLPQGESQELSLLFLSYLLQSRGHKVVYLGQNITLNDLKDAVGIRKPDYIYTMITESYSNQSIHTFVGEMEESFPDSTILISGHQVAAQSINGKNNVVPLVSLQETLTYLENLS